MRKVVHQVLEFSFLLDCGTESPDVLCYHVRLLKELLLDVSLDVGIFTLQQQVLQDLDSWSIDVVLDAVDKFLNLAVVTQRNDDICSNEHFENDDPDAPCISQKIVG